MLTKVTCFSGFDVHSRDASFGGFPEQLGPVERQRRRLHNVRRRRRTGNAAAALRMVIFKNFFEKIQTQNLIKSKKIHLFYNPWALCSKCYKNPKNP